MVGAGQWASESWAAVCHADPPLAMFRGTALAGLLTYHINQAVRGNDVTKEAQEAAVTCGWLLEWGLHGTPILTLTHSLAAALLLTDPGGMCGSSLRLPFPAFVVRLPSPSPLVFSLGESAASDCIEIRVSEISAAFGEDASHAHRVVPQLARAIASEHPQRADRIARLTAALCERPWSWEPWTELTCTSELGEFFEAQERPADDAPIRRWLDGDGDVGPASGSPVAIRLAHRLVANLAAYLQQDDLPADEERAVYVPPVPGHKRREAVLGRHVKLPRTMRLAAHAFCLRGSSPEAWARMTKYVVRGHIHRYWYGAKNGERILRARWVRSYWRGPEDGVAMPRIYDVAERKETQ